MDENKIVKIAAAGFIGLVLIPTVIGVGMKGIAYAAVAIDNLQAKIRFNRKIKKGLKDGSIIEIDGQYYEVQVTEEA